VSRESFGKDSCWEKGDNGQDIGHVSRTSNGGGLRAAETIREVNLFTYRAGGKRVTAVLVEVSLSDMREDSACGSKKKLGGRTHHPAQVGGVGDY